MDITRRLQENRQIELAKSILESAGYTVTRVNESWPTVLNNLRKYDKDRIRAELKRKGYDIENFSTEDIQLTSGRDTRIKKGMTIAVFPNHYSGGIAVWINGEPVLSTYLQFESTANMSWKKILEYEPKTYYMAFDAEASQAMRDKQQSRKEAQSGTVNRYNAKTKPRYAQIDKSGYIIDPKKYENMLAEMKFSQGSQILQNAKELYMKLADNLDKIDWENDNAYYNYETVMRGIVTSFSDLSKELARYQRAEKKYKEEYPDKYKDFLSWSKQSVVDCIKQIRNYMKEAKKYENISTEK